MQNLFGSYYHVSHVHMDMQQVADSICNLQQQHHDGRMASNEGGWQSHDLSTYALNSCMQQVLSCIEHGAEPVMEHCSFYGHAKIQSAWANINGSGHYNISHVHRFSVVSGVLYVQAAANCGNLVFENPNEALPYYLGPVKDSNAFNSTDWSIQPVPGMMVYFPSYLRHHVLPNKSMQDRISIAFNLSVI